MIFFFFVDNSSIGNTTCLQNKFQCPNGRCINKANVCDGQCDCLEDVNGYCADETDCANYYIKVDGMVSLHYFYFCIFIFIS